MQYVASCAKRLYRFALSKVDTLLVGSQVTQTFGDSPLQPSRSSHYHVHDSLFFHFTEPVPCLNKWPNWRRMSQIPFSNLCLHTLSTGMGALGAQGSPWHTSWLPLSHAHDVSGPWDLSGSFSCTPVSCSGGWQWGVFCKTANLKDPPPGYAPLFTAFPMIPPCSCNNGALLDRLGSPYKLSYLWAPPVPRCVSREFWFTSLGNLVL